MGGEGRGWGAVHQILGDPKKGPLKALPFHSQISSVILLTLCHTIPMMFSL